MRIAVTFENEQVFQHFGQTERFKVYDVVDGKVLTTSVVNTNGSGHGALADILKKGNIDTLICGGIGAGAQRAVAEANIKLYGGVTGNADKAVEDMIAGTLVYNPNVECNHHGEHHHSHGHGHECSGDCHDHAK